MTTWQCSYRGDLCAISSKNTLLPALKKLICSCRFACRIFKGWWFCEDLRWQARYMIPHPTAVGPANTNHFTCTLVPPFNNIGTCGWCLSNMLLGSIVSSTPPLNPFFTFSVTHVALDTVEWRLLLYAYNSVNTGWIRHAFKIADCSVKRFT